MKASGSIIPLPEKRWCGDEFKDDNYYIQSAEKEANRLINHFQLMQKHNVLDVGCGQGRLPIGILRVIGEINYIGIDVHLESIDWCQRYIQRRHPTFVFKHFNIYNERYNKEGIQIDDKFRFEIASKSIDIIYLYSVFSHTTEEDMRVYLKEFSRILNDQGKIFLTTFVEEGVDDYSINPKDYHTYSPSPLHIVRYNKNYLFSTFNEYGFSVLNFTYGSETAGQSAIYLSKR